MAARQLRLTKIAVSLAVLVLVVTVTGADAYATRVHRSDVVATRLYLLAVRERSRVGERESPRSLADIHGLVARVKAQCPNVLAGAPETEVVGDLRFQTLEQIAKAASGPVRDAEIQFAKTTKTLRWSNRKLDYYVHGSAEEAQANAELKIPDVCKEARAIVTNGYRTAPSTMIRFEKELHAANNKVKINVETSKPSKEESGDLPEMIMALLRPYEQPDERRLLPHKQTPKQEERALKIIFGFTDELIEALGIQIERKPPTVATPTHPPAPSTANRR